MAESERLLPADMNVAVLAACDGVRGPVVSDMLVGADLVCPYIPHMQSLLPRFFEMTTRPRRVARTMRKVACNVRGQALLCLPFLPCNQSWLSSLFTFPTASRRRKTVRACHSCPFRSSRVPRSINVLNTLKLWLSMIPGLRLLSSARSLCHL